MAKNDDGRPNGAPANPPGTEPPTDEDISVEDEDDEDLEDENDEGEDDTEESESDKDEPKEDLAATKARLERELSKKNSDSLRNRRKRREAESARDEALAELKRLKEGDTPDTQAQLVSETERADKAEARFVRAEFATALLGAGFTGSRRAAKRLLTAEVRDRIELDDDGEIDNIEEILDELKEDFPGSFSEETEEEPARTPAAARLTAADKGGKTAAKKAAAAGKTTKFKDPTLQQAAFLFNPRQVTAVANSRNTDE